jgi:hypothetical protein
MTHVLKLPRACRLASRFGILALATFACSTDVWAQAPDLPDLEPDSLGWMLMIDEDALVPGGNDRDYTAGFAVTLAGAPVTDWTLGLHGMLDWVLDSFAEAPPHAALHSVRLGGLAFTPENLEASDVILDDRPYASLMFVSTGSLHEAADGRSATHAGIMIGVLGLEVMSDLQDAIHDAIGIDEAYGWGHQISDGGEPTAQFTLGRQRLLSRTRPTGSTAVEFKDGWDLSVGTQTAAAYGWTMRWGRYESPWWSHVPQQLGYLTPEVPMHRVGGYAHKELYLSAGARVKLSAYNAILQGQFRHSDHRLSYDELRPAMVEVWLGMVWEFTRGYRAGWIARAQSSELRDGQGDRSMPCGGLFFSGDL